MTTVEIALLIGAVGAAWLGAAAFLALADPYDKLHAAGYVAILTGGGATLAVVADNPISASALKAIVILILSVGLGAILMHAVGRALFLRDASGDQR